MTTHALTEIKRGDAVTGYKCACGTFNPAGNLIAQSYQVLAHADQVIDAPGEGKYYRELWATNPPKAVEYHRCPNEGQPCFCTGICQRPVDEPEPQSRWDDMGTYYEETP